MDCRTFGVFNKKYFSTLETRTRISHNKSRTTRREQKFLSPIILCFKTRPRIISFNLRHRDEIKIYFFFNLRLREEWEYFNLNSVFETRTRIFNIAISPWEIRFGRKFTCSSWYVSWYVSWYASLYASNIYARIHICHLFKHISGSFFIIIIFCWCSIKHQMSQRKCCRAS